MQASPTVSAENPPLENIGRIWNNRVLLAFLGHFCPVLLDSIKNLSGNNRLMGASNHNQVFLACGHLPMKNGFGPPLHHVTSILIFLQNLRNRPGLPVTTTSQCLMGDLSGLHFILSWGGIATLIKQQYNPIERDFFISPLENLAYHRSRHRINNQFVTVIRVFHISKWRPATHILALFHILTSLGLYLASYVQRIGFVNHIFQREDNTAVEIIRVFRVKLIRNADEPDIMGRKITLNVISRVNGIASQARQILDDHTAYFAGFNIRKHPLEAVTVEIRACCSIVDIDVVKTQFGLPK